MKSLLLLTLLSSCSTLDPLTDTRPEIVLENGRIARFIEHPNVGTVRTYQFSDSGKFISVDSSNNGIRP